jgi:predicted transcriptional regulator
VRSRGMTKPTRDVLKRSDAISVRVSKEAKAELQTIADAERRTLSQLVAIIIEDYLDSRRTKKG